VSDTSVALTESMVHAANGIKLQFINTLRVRVESDLGELKPYVGEWYDVYPVGKTVTYARDGVDAIIVNGGRMCREGVLSRLSCKFAVVYKASTKSLGWIW
jgi:hypothetical protein